MFKRMVLVVTVFSAVTVAAFTVRAAGESGAVLKVGTVDFQRALQETEEGKRVEKQLGLALDERKKKFEILKKELDAMRIDFEKQRLVLSGAPLEEKKQALQNKLLEVEQTGVSYEQEMTQKKAESVRKILTGLQEEIKKIGTEEKFDFIYERSQGGVLFSSGAVDLTDRVIKAYNTRVK